MLKKVHIGLNDLPKQEKLTDMITKGVIFDFNGTLFFDGEKHFQAWNQLSLEIRHKELSEEELHTKCHGVPNEEVIAYLFHKKVFADEVSFYSRKKEAYYRALCLKDIDNFHLVKGVSAYFDFLKTHHIPFTIASASIKENIDFFVSSFHLDKWIPYEQIVYDDGTYVSKSGMFEKSANILHVEKQHVLIFEDSIAGVKSARHAGFLNVVGIDNGQNKELYEQKQLLHILKDFHDIEALDDLVYVGRKEQDNPLSEGKKRQKR